MRQRGTFLVPTLVAPAMIARHGIEAGIPEYVVQKASGVLDIHRESFRRAVRGGVRIAMGTDAGTPFNRHGANAQELGLMVECGLSPADTIVAATRNAAELLDLLDVTGTVEVGKAADLLVVDGDPLASIRILEDRDRLPGILKDGLWVRRARARRRLTAGLRGTRSRPSAVHHGARPPVLPGERSAPRGQALTPLRRR